MIIIWEGLSSPLWNKKWLQDLTRLIAEKASAMLDIQAIFNMCFQMICSADQNTVLFLYLPKLCLFSKGNIEFHMVFHPCFSRSFTHSIGFSRCFSYIPFYIFFTWYFTCDTVKYQVKMRCPFHRVFRHMIIFPWYFTFLWKSMWHPCET